MLAIASGLEAFFDWVLPSLETVQANTALRDDFATALTGYDLQAHGDLSDRDAVAAVRCDIRWKVACGLPLDHEGFPKVVVSGVECPGCPGRRGVADDGVLFGGLEGMAASPPGTLWPLIESCASCR
jgi:hypothetical protein